MMKLRYLKNQTGMILAVVAILGVAFSVIALSILGFSLAHYASARNNLAAIDALAVAEAGADNFMYNINQNGSYSGTNTVCPITSSGSHPVTLFDQSTSGNYKGKGTYETCVVNGSISNEKIVYSVGKIYLPATATTPTVTRKLKLVIEGSGSAPYAVQTGPGGLILSNNVVIGNGQVYVNGYITMGNNSAIGTTLTPAKVWAANYQCPAANPPGSTYPALCGSGEPITIGNNAHIYGDVNANGEIFGGSNANKMSQNGLQSNSGVAPTTLPDPDRAGTKATISSTMTAANASSCSGSYKTWTNVHITGSVSLPNNCTITIGGNVWIDGDLTTGNNNVVQASNILTTQAQVMIDGANGLNLGNNTTLASNPSNIGFKFVTYWNASGNLDATSLTGNDLYNSMYISNNRNNPNYTITTGNNSSIAAGTTLYARWSGVSVQNNGTVGSIVGQIINLGNNGTISFNNGSGGTPEAWDVRYYEPIPNTF